MSHVITVKNIRFSNIALLKRVCNQQGYSYTERQPVKMFGTTVQNPAMAVRLEGWSYPVTVADDGEIKYDNFGGQWGDIEKLHELCRSYSQAAVREALDAQGLRCTGSETLEHGTQRLTFEERPQF